MSHAHMKMQYPVPLRDPSLGGYNADYDETSPLDPNGSDFPCKGYADDPWNQQASWTAGQTYNMSVTGGASHGGGSCQLSLSYDKVTFRVIKSVIGGCPLAKTYDFTIPSDAPSGRALFAWTWQNEVGNREYYMSCSQVDITGGPDDYNDDSAALSDLPQIWVANVKVDGQMNCSTVEGTDAVYPHPGCDVQYGNGHDSSSRAAEGNCDFGSSQPDCSGYTAGVFAEGSPDASGPASSAIQAVIDANMPSDMPGMDMGGGMDGGMNMAEQPAATVTATASATTTSTQSLMSLITVTDFGPSTWGSRPTGPPPGLINPFVRLGTALRSPGAVSTSNCSQLVTVTNTAPPMTVTANSSSRTATPPPPPPPSLSRPPNPSSAAPPPPPPPPPPGSNAPYAGANVLAFMPCKPGAFLCSDARTFWTCDQTLDAGERWRWQYPRPVAAGMM
ncbi:MAG: hypothetical protein INR71_09740, partial [Terriglobus roseus]|nr:hypothetical protein [Terriglobus roseus]